MSAVLSERNQFAFEVATISTPLDREPAYTYVFDAASIRTFGDYFHDLDEATRGREDLDFAILAPQIYTEAGKGMRHSRRSVLR
jgi:hypothetical protein